MSDLTLHKADALDFLPTLAAGSVDCVCCDPPYESLNKWRAIGTTTRLGGHRDEDKRQGWFDTIGNEDLFTLLCEFARVLPKSGHAWVMAALGDALVVLLGCLLWPDRRETGTYLDGEGEGV